jgi:hypothetical protein
LPEDDGPTMTGAPGERRADHALPAVDATDGDDTTTAEAGPPASRRDDPSVAAAGGADDEDADETGRHDPHDHEDRTVQQKVDPPLAARKPSGLAQYAPASAAPKPASAPPSRPPAPVPPAGVPASAPLPSTEPGAVMSTAPAAPPVTRSTETDIEPTDITDELDDELAVDEDDHVEDSITATAPRISHANLMDAAQSGHGVPVTIPGSVEIRTVEHDDLLDETEIRTRPGHSPLHIPLTLRSSPAPLHTSSQPPPPPRPVAGRPPSTAAESESAARMAARAASPRPAAGMPFQPVVEDPPTRPGVEGALDSGDEPATRPGVEGADEPPTRPGVPSADEPPTHPGLGESPTRPGAPDPETAERLDVQRAIDAAANSYANEDDEDDEDDESVTTRGRVAEPYEADESVTTQAPAVPHSVIEAAINAPRGIIDATLDDGTDGTTQRVKKREAALSSPADGEAESITTQAPGPLTNILRVIASGSSPELGSDPGLPLLEEDEPPENRTAVMANAPLKRLMSELASASSLPAIRPTGGPMLHGPHGSAAPRLEPSSESGLRVARAGGVDRASLGALGIADASGRHSGIGRTASALASDGSISAASTGNGDLALFPSQVQPSVHDVDLGKGPRYGLLVAIVAVISVIVPVTLFAVLHHPSEALVPGVPAEPASEIQKHDGARIKAVRGKNGQMTAPAASAASSASGAPATSAAPATSSSSKPGAKGFPFRR